VRQADGAVLFEVEDQGIGIPKAEQVKIFDRFYRSGNGTGKGGYGLGLFMVSHIARAHGGSVEVESEPGAGSTFRLKIPVVAP
jgi:signal transduction histidine kinase